MTNYDLFVGNVRSALGGYYDADAGLICSIALLTAEHDRLRQSAALSPQGSEPAGVGTPSSRWSAAGEPDPHGDRYNCERAALAMGDMSDDELANAVFMYGDTKPSMADLISGKAIMPSAYLTAAKDRIRWLSRKLATPAPAQQAVTDGMVLVQARDLKVALGALPRTTDDVGLMISYRRLVTLLLHANTTAQGASDA